ncbi:hypothetical protein acsn021_17400 [Anaerocolumna cellulosilytica]|uniref:Uncharacterized protein n=1 Tax=Anaerocolumna cellulosilytica TaxID=433286 RepID=A0A6S6R511_9FIRM|nr:non-ribosomal peptide synthetase [Anaerocolumna cellulosilytica]MBB5194866.1 amino acid adenylation domain-containing protein [Anaerocolumna cellulosilytica]BCJ94171.1 hypothetical protein acsn021_17400 [Anaerocolumna cellulosilytica]
MNREVKYNILKTSHKFHKQRRYWENKINNICINDGYTVKQKGDNQESKKSTYSFKIEKELYRRIYELSNNDWNSVFAILLSGIVFVWGKCFGKKTFSAGTPVFSKHNQSISDLLIIYILFDLNKTFKEFLYHIRQELIDTYVNSSYPINELLNEKPNNIFDIFVEFTNIHKVPHRADYRTNLFFSFNADQEKEEITGEIQYNQSLFPKDMIKSVTRIIINFIDQVTHNKDISLRDIELMSLEEKNSQLKLLNTAKSVNLPDGSLYSLIENKMLQSCTKNALIFGDDKMSYKQLGERVNETYITLKQTGVKKGSVVVINISRGFDLITTILSVLKCEAICLPIDNKTPEARMKYMIENASADFIVHNKEGVVECSKCIVNSIKQVHNECIYIIYTSGSSGTPKGVMLSEKGIKNHAFAKIKDLGITSLDRVAFNFSINFVASIWQIISPLLVGAEIVIYNDDVLKDSYDFMKKVQQDRVTTLALVPSSLHTFLLHIEHESELIDLHDLNTLLLTGEKVPAELPQRFYRYYSTKLMNGYGQSECCDDTLHYIIPNNQMDKEVPIGRPITNTRVYILDTNKKMLPIGFPGELCITGDCLSFGYLDDNELNKKRFISLMEYERNNFVYCTGDIVRCLEDGTIEYIGRRDRQVKIRGYRIEIEEIEARLKKHPEINDAAVIVKDSQDEKYLCAFIVSCLKEIQIKDNLKEWLPEYLIPSKIVVVNELPVLPSGKIDYCSLNQVECSHITNELQLIEMTPFQKKLKEIFCYALNINDIGMDDSFFDMGGDSLNVIKVTFHLTEYAIEIHAKDVYKYSTIRSLSKYIIETHQIDSKEIEYKVREIWIKLLKKSEIDNNINFFDLGGSSLLITEMLTMLTEVFRIDINISDIFAYSTIKDLSEYIYCLQCKKERILYENV